MRRALTALLYPVSAIFGAHALVYFLGGALPHAAVSALGLFSADENLLSAFSQSYPLRPYLEALSGLFAGNLGQTLDGQPVTTVLAQALLESLPRFAGAVFILGGVCFLTAVSTRGTTPSLQALGEFIAFLPAYVAPFLGLAVLLAVQLSTGTPFPGVAFEFVAVLALSTSGAALLAAQTARITQRNLSSQFAASIRAAGATYWQLRCRLLHNLISEISPTFEKVVVGLMAAMLFTETILGLSGFGTLAIRAVRRSDIDLLLGVTLIVASVVALSRILTWIIRTGYGVEE